MECVSRWWRRFDVREPRARRSRGTRWSRWSRRSRGSQRSRRAPGGSRHVRRGSHDAAAVDGRWQRLHAADAGSQSDGRQRLRDARRRSRCSRCSRWSRRWWFIHFYFNNSLCSIFYRFNDSFLFFFIDYLMDFSFFLNFYRLICSFLKLI